MRALRQEQGLSLRQLAVRPAISPTYLGEVERGLKEPSSEMLDRLALALGVTVADLLGRVAGELGSPDALSVGESGGQAAGSDRESLEEAVDRIARQLPASDLHSLARFGEFLLSRPQA